MTNEDILSAIEEMKKNNKNEIPTEMSDIVSSYLNGKSDKGKAVAKSLAKYDSTTYKSNTKFDLVNNKGRTYSYSQLLSGLSKINTNFVALNQEYINSQPTSTFIETIVPVIEDTVLAAIDLSNNFDTLSSINDQENINFTIIDNAEYAYTKFDNATFSAIDDKSKYKKVLNSNKKVGLAMSLVSSIKSERADEKEYIKVNPYEVNIATDTTNDIYPEGGSPNWLSNPNLEDLIELSHRNSSKWDIKLAADENSSLDEKESFKATYQLADGTRGYINSNASALSSVANLTASDTLGDKEGIDNLKEIISTFWFRAGSNSSNISEAIYAIYNNGTYLENGKEAATSAYGFNKWTNVTASQLYAGGLDSKSELGLISSTLFNFKDGYSFTGNKLVAATVIGYKNYSISGRKTTDYISSNESILPVGEEQDYSKFAKGRKAALLKNIDDEVTGTTHKANNYAIQAIVNSGPDFMANMFDACIFEYNNKESKSSNFYAEPIFSFTTAPNVYYNPEKNMKSTDIVDKGIPLTTRRMFSTREDFVSRIQSISIPELKGSTGDLNFLNQSIKYILPNLENSFESQLVIEQDADLEYMRLFNRLSGLSFKTKINIATDDSKINWSGITEGGIPNDKNFIPNRTNAGTLQNHAGYYGIAIILRPTSYQRVYNYLIKDNLNILVFENVKFLGGGEVSFKNSAPTLATYTQKFIYKNVDILKVNKSLKETLSNRFSVENNFDHTMNNKYYTMELLKGKN